jgi:hypothetical protein
MRKPLNNRRAIGLVLIAVTVLNMPFLSQKAIAADILSIGFENASERQGNCGTGGVSCAAPYAAITQIGPYINDASFCHSGSWCSSHALPGGLFQSSISHDINMKTLAYEGHYWHAAWRFPSTFRFQTGDNDWKAMLWEGTTYRLYFNFRTNSNDKTRATPAFCIRNCQSAADWVYGSGGERVMTDDKWHTVEVYTSGSLLQMWYDGVLEISTSAANLTGAVIEWKVGAYQNGAIPFNETFYVDDIQVSTQRIGGSDPTSSPPTEPSSLQVR